MRKDQWILIDNLKRKIFLKHELKRKITKSILKNNSILPIYRYLALYNKSKLSRWSTLPQQTNRCFVSGRSWSVSKLTSYSRFEFRSESYKGNLPGFQRASW